MAIDQIRRLHQAQPFHAFRLHLADSRSLSVTHPENIAINEPGRTISVAADGAFEIVDLLLVVGVELLNGQTGKKGKRGA